MQHAVFSIPSHPRLSIHTEPLGLWPHTGLGHFGGGEEWARVPIAFAPNPVQCQWIGPRVCDFDCSSCGLGYETTSTNDTTCVTPKFKPYRGWDESTDRKLLQPVLQDPRGVPIKRTDGSDTFALSTSNSYTIPAPKLEPKEAMFVGYAQPFAKIHYELDFSLGAEVDIGCGTTVFGNGAVDENIPKSRHAHPLSMQTMSYQWPGSRGNPSADPPDYGYYPWRCPRYHRFKVTHAGNFTFVRSDFCPHFAILGFPVSCAGQLASSRVAS